MKNKRQAPGLGRILCPSKLTFNKNLLRKLSVAKIVFAVIT